MHFLRRLFEREEVSAAEAAESPEPASVPSRPRLEVGWATDVGKTRDHNEDTALVITAAHDGGERRPWFGLFVLADGMGGHRAGEMASSLAAREAAHHIARHVYLPSLTDREHDANRPALTEILVDAVQAANDAVSEQLPGSGTTLTCALVLGTQAYVGHVGDSRAYLLTEEGLDQITHDHSLLDRLISLGELAREEAAEHPQKNVLYRAVGQSGRLEVDTHVRKIPPGDYLLLCSDGLWDMVDEDVIFEVVTEASSLQGACEDLVAAANRAGGRDNTTAILWRSPQA
jgi:protein phosphatase